MLTLPLLVASCAAAGATGDAGAFQRRLDETWAQVGSLVERGATPEAEALQRTMADECWAYHEKHPRTPTGDNALVGAFMMWRNVGDHGRIERVLPRIDPEAAVWYRILPFVRGAYLKAGRETDYRALFERLGRELEHPLARSEVLQSLADDHVLAGELERAGVLYREIVALDADPVYVSDARRALREIDTLAPGRPAPPFEAVDVHGHPVSLADLGGKVVLLEFWGTFCAPCIPELAHLERLRARYPPSDLAIVGVAFDRSSESVRRFLKRRPLDWPQLCDGRGEDGDIARLYNVEQLPRSFVIDREGRIAAKDHRGAELDEVVDGLVAAGRERGG